MIGLGSNRLSVCRRGGMSVTQAGRGGMEWLAGIRYPDWATPYSAQATAALKDAFTAAQWQTIRDYGFAHPEIVGYMNAYAPEDAKIAYSLVEGIGTRYLQNDGASYIKSGIAPSSDMVIKVIFYANSCNLAFVGVRDASAQNRTMIALDENGSPILFDLYNGRTSKVITTGKHEASLYIATKKGKLDSDEFNLTTSGSTLSSKEMYIMALNNNGSAAYWVSNGALLSDVQITKTGLSLHLVPYKSATYGFGMIDIPSGTFYKNEGSGSFTESIETPAS